METERQNMTQQIQASTAQTAIGKASKPLIRQFEIAVYDVTINDSTGKEEYRPIAYTQPVIVEARSLQELNNKLAIYHQCGQRAKVIREVNPSQNAEKLMQQNSAEIANEQLKSCQKNEVVNKPAIEATHESMSIAQLSKRKPKIYRLGDIEIKDDNGKIYQKQWMKLTDTEAANFRIISDKNNSVTSLAGKHIEMKKWVLVENSADDETAAIEESLS